MTGRKSNSNSQRSPSSKRSSGKLRPRVWVPGVLYVSDERVLRSGVHVGFNGWGKHFSFGPCGHFSAVSDWRHRAWLVERSKLTPDLVDEHAIILPERLLDAEEQPHARRWLEGQSLVCVSGTKEGRLVEQGLRVFIVEYGVEGEELLRVQAVGGKRASWSLNGPLPAFWPRGSEGAGEDIDGLPAAEKATVRATIDRLLRAVSRDVLTEMGVVNALSARLLVEPGYGYYGARDGRAATIEQVQRAAAPLEALFEQIYQRAEGQQEDAEAIAQALRTTDPRGREITVALYGRARRQRIAEYTVSMDENAGVRWIAGDHERDELVVPDESIWIVDRVDSWSPKLPPELALELEDAARRDARRPSPWTALALVGILLLIIALALWQL
jgi:hypothetical protein